MINKVIEKIILLVAAATFFVPLIFAPKNFIFPFIVPKIVVLRSLVLLLLGLYVLLLSIDWQRYRPRLTPTMIGVLAFWISFAISTFAGVDWYRSFWDNHERMLGLFTVSHYILLYIILASVMKSWDQWKWLLRAFLMAGGVVMVIAAIQRYYNPEFLLNRSGSRTASTLGNPIYVSGYGLFLVFLGYFLVWRERHLFWRVFAVMGGALGFLGIFWGGTRGAFLGFLAGVCVLLLTYIIVHRHNRRVRIASIFIVAITVIAFVALFSYRRTIFVQKIPVIGSLLNVSLSSGTANTRIMAWGVAWEGFLDRPIFGWGPSNYYYAFNKYYRAEFLEHGWQETWFDNAHNIVMNTLTERGVIGLLFYLGLFGITIRSLILAYRRGMADAHTAGVGSAFLVAHFTAATFVFENPTSYLYFFVFLAALDNLSATVALSTGAAVIPRKLSLPLSGLAAMVILLMVYATNINPARANMNTLRLLRIVYRFADPAYKPAVDPTTLYETHTIIPTPHIDDIRNDFVRTAIDVLDEMARSGKGQEARNLAVFAFKELEKNRALHPLDIRVHLAEGQLAQHIASLTGYAELLVDAEPIVEEAVRLSPERQQGHYLLVGIKLPLGKTDEAIAILRQSIANDPKIAEGWWRLAYILRDVGKLDEAKELVREARSRGLNFDERGAEIVNSILPVSGTPS